MIKGMRKIEWNKVTWYSKIIALALFVLLPYVGFWIGVSYGQSLQAIQDAHVAISLPAASDATSAYYQNVAAWQTDVRPDAGFSISYPLDFTADDNYSIAPSADWRMGANGTQGIKAFTLTIPRAFEPQTNFDDATLTVGRSSSNGAVAGCMASDPSGGPASATSTVLVNGITFTVFHSNDAGAGNYYETTSYRTLHAGQCYAVEYTVHSSQIANYPTSYDLQPLNEMMLTDVLDRIVGTFKLK